MTTRSDPTVLSSHGAVDFHREGHTAWITITNQARMNALSRDVRDGLARALDEVAVNDEIRSCILTGAGGVAFCAGADLKELGERDASGAPTSSTQEIRQRVSECPKPVIAAIDGYALAGGMQLAARADIRIATEGSSFGMPEVRRSLLAAGQEDTPERFLPPGEAMFLLLTGLRISARRAHDLGFVQRIVSNRADLIVEARTIAEAIAAGAPLAVVAAKRLVQRTRHQSPHDAADLHRALFERIELSDDRKEGPRAFVEKRDPIWKGR